MRFHFRAKKMPAPRHLLLKCFLGLLCTIAFGAFAAPAQTTLHGGVSATQQTEPVQCVGGAQYGPTTYIVGYCSTTDPYWQGQRRFGVTSAQLGFVNLLGGHCYANNTCDHPAPTHVTVYYSAACGDTVPSGYYQASVSYSAYVFQLGAKSTWSRAQAPPGAPLVLGAASCSQPNLQPGQPQTGPSTHKPPLTTGITTTDTTKTQPPPPEHITTTHPPPPGPTTITGNTTAKCCDCPPGLSEAQCFQRCNAMLPRCSSGPSGSPTIPQRQDSVCRTCDCGTGATQDPTTVYASGLVQGFTSCLAGTLLGPLSEILADGQDLASVAHALLNGDTNTAAALLQVKGERNRAQFDQFWHSLGPTLNAKIIGASPQEAGLRDGFRLCALGVIPGVIKAAKTPIPGPALPLSNLKPQSLNLAGASAEVAINNRAAGVGLLFEESVGGNLPQPNFPVIDAVPPGELQQAVYNNGGLLENPSEISSIKTLRATPTSYKRSGAVLSRLRGYLNSLNNYTTGCRKGIRVTAGPRTKRILKLGIPPVATQQQLAQIDRAALLAREMGIVLEVYELLNVKGWGDAAKTPGPNK